MVCQMHTALERATNMGVLGLMLVTFVVVSFFYVGPPPMLVRRPWPSDVQFDVKLKPQTSGAHFKRSPERSGTHPYEEIPLHTHTLDSMGYVTLVLSKTLCFLPTPPKINLKRRWGTPRCFCSSKNVWASKGVRTGQVYVHSCSNRAAQKVI